MKYGSKEFAFAEPFAAALISDAKFRSWLLKKTKFAEHADVATVPMEEMATRRGLSQTWWRSHYTERCRCEGCSGQETDILAIFAANDFRFALHVEVKQPDDRFPSGKNQGLNYALRANCWIKSPPVAVLTHTAAGTMLLCSGFKLKDYGDQAKAFESVVTFESLRLDFPNATASL